MAAEIERAWKGAFDIVEAVEQPCCHLAVEEGELIEAGRGAVAMAADCGAVEYLIIVTHAGVYGTGGRRNKELRKRTCH